MNPRIFAPGCRGPGDMVAGRDFEARADDVIEPVECAEADIPGGRRSPVYLRLCDGKPALFLPIPDMKDAIMVEKPSASTPVEDIPSVQDGISAIASANAPFLYFDNAPTFGHYNGTIRVTLTAARDMPVGGAVRQDAVIVAHLRMNVTAALALKSAIEGALLLASPRPTDQKLN
jgi:hypothetical protein